MSFLDVSGIAFAFKIYSCLKMKTTINYVLTSFMASLLFQILELKLLTANIALCAFKHLLFVFRPALL